jgi:CubicO group peptidase (beta-lactamase class C family)
MYFPPSTGATWTTITAANVGWNQSAVQPLIDYVAAKNTKAFIILVNGRIVLENYFGSTTAASNLYWASAGKTLVATTVGIAQENNLLNINSKVSSYIGNGWTSAPLVKENLITLKGLLTMTSGLDDTLGDDVSPANLQYVADAGTRWAYHGVFVKLQDVVAAAAGTSWNNYFNTKLRDRMGMDGSWVPLGNLSVYFSTARSMARFGLLSLNKGNWDGTQIINQNYFTESISTSQIINPAYGYLWWINGKTSYRLPQTQMNFLGSLVPDAPADMYMALGKNDQKIYVVPSKKMVVIRLGDAAEASNFALSTFDNTLWQKINALYQ